ncbi:PAAR domain-containing protein [Advenella kashmirensis]|uniref:PAAR domain-containing protein n=1 Tax=Advenella kashmirensis TaxID=310575 RepID=UPI0009DA3461|nr:PAAR domain-containing protein [Advenella kashmirensis]
MEGRKIARVGDKTTSQETGDFITDGALATIDGRRIACHGGTTSCGAKLIVPDEGPTV